MKQCQRCYRKLSEECSVCESCGLPTSLNFFSPPTLQEPQDFLRELQHSLEVEKQKTAKLSQKELELKCYHSQEQQEASEQEESVELDFFEGEELEEEEDISELSQEDELEQGANHFDEDSPPPPLRAAPPPEEQQKKSKRKHKKETQYIPLPFEELKKIAKESRAQKRQLEQIEEGSWREVPGSLEEVESLEVSLTDSSEGELEEQLLASHEINEEELLESHELKGGDTQIISHLDEEALEDSQQVVKDELVESQEINEEELEDSEEMVEELIEDSQELPADEGKEEVVCKKELVETLEELEGAIEDVQEIADSEEIIAYHEQDSPEEQPHHLSVVETETYPKGQWDWLIFSDQESDPRGYTIAGQTQQDDSLAELVFTSSTCSEVWDQVSSKHRKQLGELIKQQKFFASLILLRQIYPSLPYQEGKKFLKKLAKKEKVKFPKKILTIEHLSNKVQKKLKKMLQQGKTLDAIYYLRRKANLPLKESRKEIECFCELNELVFDPLDTQQASQFSSKKLKANWWKWLSCLFLLTAILAWLYRSNN